MNRNIKFVYYFLLFNVQLIFAENSLDETLLKPKEIPEQECKEDDDLIVDRDHDHNQRDERRNLYEYNRDQLREEAERDARKRRRYNRYHENSTHSYPETEQYYYYPQ